MTSNRLQEQSEKRQVLSEQEQHLEGAEHAAQTVPYCSDKDYAEALGLKAPIARPELKKMVPIPNPNIVRGGIQRQSQL